MHLVTDEFNQSSQKKRKAYVLSQLQIAADSTSHFTIAPTSIVYKWFAFLINETDSSTITAFAYQNGKNTIYISCYNNTEEKIGTISNNRRISQTFRDWVRSAEKKLSHFMSLVSTFNQSPIIVKPLCNRFYTKCPIGPSYNMHNKTSLKEIQE